MQLNADTHVRREQVISIYLGDVTIEDNVDTVILELVPPHGRPRRVTLPFHLFTGDDGYGMTAAAPRRPRSVRPTPVS